MRAPSASRSTQIPDGTAQPSCFMGCTKVVPSIICLMAFMNVQDIMQLPQAAGIAHKLLIIHPWLHPIVPAPTTAATSASTAWGPQSPGQ